MRGRPEESRFQGSVGRASGREGSNCRRKGAMSSNWFRARLVGEEGSSISGGKLDVVEEGGEEGRGGNGVWA